MLIMKGAFFYINLEGGHISRPIKEWKGSIFYIPRGASIIGKYGAWLGRPSGRKTEGGTGVKHLGLKSDLHIIWLGILGLKIEVFDSNGCTICRCNFKNWLEFVSITYGHGLTFKEKKKNKWPINKTKQQTILKKDIFIHDHFSMYFTLKIIVIGF